MNTAHRSLDNLVIGGGPAGSMTAILLAQAGRQVTLLEREREPHHKVCGEFLSREAVDYLQRAGIAPLDLGATSIRFLRLSCGNRTTQTVLPFRTLSLSRRTLDTALLERAANRGCDVQYGSCVKALAGKDGVWQATLNDGASLRARNVFLATGKHDLRGWQRERGRQNDLVGFKMHWQLPSAQIEELHESMELFLFRGGYGGLSLVERDTANFCFVVRQRVLRAHGGYDGLFAALLCGSERLRHFLHHAQAAWPKPLAISPIPYGYAARAMHGLWCVGDQAAVIPSFTGDGISIALHSGALAAQMFLEGKTVEEYRRALCGQLGGGMRLATWLSQAMVTPAGRMLAVPVLSLLPEAMQWIATSTRIPARVLPAS